MIMLIELKPIYSPICTLNLFTALFVSLSPKPSQDCQLNTDPPVIYSHRYLTWTMFSQSITSHIPQSLYKNFDSL